jgi:hypothetical protein
MRRTPSFGKIESLLDAKSGLLLNGLLLSGLLLRSTSGVGSTVETG